MIEIVNVELSKQTAKTGEQVIVTMEIRETVGYPYKYPYKYPKSYTGVALPQRQNN